MIAGQRVLPVVRRLEGFAPQRATNEYRSDGTILVTSPEALGTPARDTSVWLHRWSEETPNRIFIAERSGEGWRRISYAEAQERVVTLASALLSRDLGPHRPIAVLSGSGVDHGLLALAAQYVGIPIVPLAEQYGLIPEAHGRLIHILERVRPGLVFASDAGPFAKALALDVLDGVEITAVRTDGAPREMTPFERLQAGVPAVDVAAANAKVGPHTLAKILFTSGSTGTPKGVLTTQAMMCVNQLQMRQVWPFLGDHPPQILDWLPWNHVFGGSHNFNLMLSNGGTLYVDDGKPTAKAFDRTVRNIKDVGHTISFNVPMAFAMLAERMHVDDDLRRAFFNNLDLIFYAGASLPQDVWATLEQMAMRENGIAPLMSSSWGMTETAPATIMVHAPIDRAGNLGAPLPGVVVKLIPDESGRCELRVRGPNITPGYFSDEEKTRAAFDEEGFLITGDAVRLAVPTEPSKGLLFEGRVAEDFKLMTGTWVQVSKLRVGALPKFVPIAADLVITGHDRSEIGVLIFPNAVGLTTMGIDAVETGGALISVELAAAVKLRLKQIASNSTGSSTRIARALVLAEPPSIQDGEITDKGALNQGKVLARRADLISRLYNDKDPAVIRL